MDRQTLMVRRGVAAAVALGLFILIILVISGCLHSQKVNSLKSYARDVNSIAQDSDQRIARPLFSDLSQASGKSAADVEVEINQLKILAQDEASRARGLSVPGDLVGAQRDLLLALDLRSEGLAQIASQISIAMGGQGASDAVNQIAGQMEALLASDVIWSQRATPLIAQVLADNGIKGLDPATSRFVLDLSWLDPATIASRLANGSSSAASGAVTPGPHGHGLASASVGSNALASGAVNRVTGGANPTFTIGVANQGGSAERNVKVDVTVTALGQTLKASKTIDRTQPGNTTNVDIPVANVPLNTPAKVTVNIEAVPGEKNLANNKGTFTVVFGP